MARDNFIFYRSFFEGVDNMPQKNQLVLYKAIMEFALNEEEPKLNGIEKAIFSLIRPQLEANNKRYEDGKRGAEHGKKGGRPKTKNPIGDKEKNPTLTPNVNVNVNDNVNDNVNVNAESTREGLDYFSLIEIVKVECPTLAKRHQALIDKGKIQEIADIEQILNEVTLNADEVKELFRHANKTYITKPSMQTLTVKWVLNNIQKVREAAEDNFIKENDNGGVGTAKSKCNSEYDIER